jgi:hypothetical protein
MATEAPATNMDQQVDLSTIPVSPTGAGAGSNDADGKVVTVFHDKENFNVKHQLQNKWTLWFTKPPSGRVGLFYSPLACWEHSSQRLQSPAANVVIYRERTGTTC